MKVNGELKNAQVEAVTNTAARPAAGQDGRVLYDIALGQLIYDNGTTWEALPKQSDTYTKAEADAAATAAALLANRVIYEEKRMATDVVLTDTGTGFITELDSSTFPNTGRYRITAHLLFALDTGMQAADNRPTGSNWVYTEFFITNAAGDWSTRTELDDQVSVGFNQDVWEGASRVEEGVLNTYVNISTSFIIDLSDSEFSATLTGGCRFRVKSGHHPNAVSAEILESSNVRIEKLPSHLSYADNSNSWT